MTRGTKAIASSGSASVLLNWASTLLPIKPCHCVKCYLILTDALHVLKLSPFILIGSFFGFRHACQDLSVSGNLTHGISLYYILTTVPGLHGWINQFVSTILTFLFISIRHIPSIHYKHLFVCFCFSIPFSSLHKSQHADCTVSTLPPPPPQIK